MLAAQHGPLSQPDDWHLPEMHAIVPMPHLCPQAPQLLGSFARSAQPRPHTTVFAAQAHVPLVHTPPGPHELSQEPQ
jgi:hypothetical protein